MSVNVTQAISAYQNTATRPAESAVAPQAGESFADVMKSTLQDAVDMGRVSEQKSMEAIEGKADLREVVLAVSQAEHALETVVAVRDKVMSAYEQIMRMPV